MRTMLKVNGHVVHVDVPDGMQLLWVLRDELMLTGTRYGCGVASCEACTLHEDGVTPAGPALANANAVDGPRVTMLPMARNGVRFA